MKILKLKSILFGLIAIVVTTVFLTSCEKEAINNTSKDNKKDEISSALQNYINKAEEISFYLPSYLDDADNETIESYTNSLTIEQIEERKESYRIENYLSNIDRIDEVYNDLGDFDLLNQSDLSKYTSEKEFADFHSLDANSVIESRAWCFTVDLGCSYGNGTEYKVCCRFLKCRKKATYYYQCDN